MSPSPSSKPKTPQRWVRLLGWLGVVFSVLVNAGLFWALAFVNQRFEGDIKDENLSQIQVYVPPTEVVTPVLEDEQEEFVQEQDDTPMESLEPLATPPPPMMRIPIIQNDVVDLNSIPVAVSDVAVTQVTQTGPMELPDVDSAPRRTKGSLPAYPSWAQSRNLEARVKVGFIVNPDGGVSNVKVIRIEGDARFKQVAIRAVQAWRFKPGMYRARAVPVRCSKEFVFRLQD